jgi:hypothetical protein
MCAIMNGYRFGSRSSIISRPHIPRGRAEASISDAQALSMHPMSRRRQHRHGRQEVGSNGRSGARWAMPTARCSRPALSKKRCPGGCSLGLGQRCTGLQARKRRDRSEPRQVQMSRASRSISVVGRWPVSRATLGALSASAVPLRKPYQPCSSISAIPLYCYRCPWNLEYPDCGVRCRSWSFF